MEKLIVKCYSNETNNLRVLYYTVPKNFVILSKKGNYTFDISKFECLQEFINTLKNKFKLNNATIAEVITKIENFI